MVFPRRVALAWVVTTFVVVGPGTGGEGAWARRIGIVARAARTAPTGPTALAAEAARAVRVGGDEAVPDAASVARARLSAGAVARERLDVLSRARELAAEGWRAYLAVEPAFAEARLAEARRTLEAALGLDGALEVMADVSLRLGAVRLFAGRKAEAEAAFALAAALDPERDVSLRDFPPDVVDAYRRARERRATADAAAELEVVSADAATIEIDGVPVGAAPVRRRVAPGEHVVVARAGAMRAGGRVVVARPGAQRVEAIVDDDGAGRMLVKAEESLLPGTEAGRVAAILSTVATWAELDEVLLLASTWRGGEPTLLGQRCLAMPAPRCGPVMELRHRPRDARRAVATLIEKLPPPRPRLTQEPILFEDTRLTSPEPPLPRRPPRRPESLPWWRDRWLWVGAGALAAAATASLFLLANDPRDSLEVTIPPCEFAQCGVGVK